MKDVYKYIREKNKTIPIVFVSGNIEFLESIEKLKSEDKSVDHLSKLQKSRLRIMFELSD